MITGERNTVLAEIPADKRAEAIRRVGIVEGFEKFAARVISENGSRTQAVAVYSLQKGIAQRTLRRWIYKYRDFGFMGLVDTRGKGVSAGDNISDEAFSLFKSMWLTQQRLSVKMCWQNICYVNQTQKKGWTIPSCRVMYNIVEREIPPPTQVLCREGQAAYEAKYAPFVQVDPDSVEPGQVWVGDHTQLNCWIWNGGKWIRPWLTAWQDMRSRAIVGYHLSSSPNQNTIMFAFKRAVKDYGPPDSVKIDNGRDYDSEMWTGTTKAQRRALPKGYLDVENIEGIYAMIGVTVSFAIPYHPQSKRIERFFDTLDCQFTKTISTYCGKGTKQKPDNLNEMLSKQKVIDKALDLQKFSKLLDRYIEAYNSSSHSGSGMDGRSPGQVLATRQSRRVILDETLDMLIQGWTRKLKVGKNGVCYKGIYYGQYEPDLLACRGRMVRLAFDPNDLRRVSVYDAESRQLITIAEQNQFVNYGDATSDEHVRTAHRQKTRAMKAYRNYRDSALTANMDITDLTIRAKEEAKIDDEVEKTQQTLRPVKTPLDGQAARYKQLKARATARPRRKEYKLDIDLSLLKPREELRPVLDFDFSKLGKVNRRRAKGA